MSGEDFAFYNWQIYLDRACGWSCPGWSCPQCRLEWHAMNLFPLPPW
jgi:hypothetical protein